MNTIQKLERLITTNTQQAELVSRILNNTLKQNREYTINEYSEPNILLEVTTIYDIVKAAQRRQFHISEYESSQNKQYITKNFTIVHTTDVHDDFQAFKNALLFADRIDANMVAQTGDIVSYTKNDISRFEDLALSIKTPYLCVLGNHEHSDPSYSDEDVFRKFLFPYVVKNRYVLGHRNRSYYYYDDPVFYIRFIALNQTPRLKHKEYWPQFNYTQEQIDWFIDTLKSTPKNYGIIVGCHNAIGCEYDNQHGDFYQITKGSSTKFTLNRDWFIKDIIDAFISRKKISVSSNVCVVDDSFETIDPSIEFIAFLTGHRHLDTIGYIPDTENKILNIGLVCAVNIDQRAIDFDNYSDKDNDTYVSKQNCYSYNRFNIYCIDRERKVLKVIRYGTNVTVDMRRRLMMEIPYV